MEKYNHKYGAEQIQVLEGLEAVRKRPGMYIGSTSVRGLHHMVYEIVDNCVDEALAGYCTEIKVAIEPENIISVEDNGRGIPVEIHPKTHISTAETVYTVLHAGGKFGGDSGYKVSGGLHGVGASVVNALSTWTEVTIKRDGGLYQMYFEKGKTVKKLEKIGDAEGTGTKVRFLADDTIFESLDYDYETLEKRFREMAFLTKGLKITIEDKREETPKKAEFCFEGGLVSFVEFLNKNKEKLHKTPIYIEKNILKHANEKIKEIFKGKKIMIISDDQVYPLYGDDLTLNLEKDFKVHHVVVPHGEKSKRFDMLPTLYKACLDFKLTRTDLIIALGGGVIGDMAGFVASSYLRGVKLVQIPTSLLAQVDSSVGGKVAVDLPEGKNLVGAFYHPSMVLIDPCTLKTLDPHFISDGMGEVIKYGCIKDKKLFDQLNSYQNFEELYEFIDEIIYNCVNIKREVVEKDQFDFGDRLLLNFGHTYAHAIEQYYHYEKYSHGEAVGIGMYQITKLAESLDLTKTESSMQIKEILQKYNLPYECFTLTGTAAVLL